MMTLTTVLDCDLLGLAGRAFDVYPEPVPFEDFGPYQISGCPIGRGGMGEVFLAYDHSAGRHVAIKFLRATWPDPDLTTRFSHEIRMLAKLEHPYIARLYDVGVHPNGTPFFVMEYVEGKPLDQFCREQNCSLEQGLRLFRSVCEAVQYAHGRLIVHRDLKPSNILVKAEATPKLLDFGIAKQLENVAEPVAQTRTDARFTYAYAAPEQLRREQIGVYTDVYALGAVLYELLAGTRPYDLEDCTPGQAELIITGDTEPPKPSLSADRVPAPRAAWKDLDLLCLKALKKEVSRRYRSVTELIQDIDHFLKNEPLQACPDAAFYRARKFVARNRTVLALASLLFILFSGMAALFTWRLSRERNAALAEAARTKRIERFTLGLFDAGDYGAGPSKDLRVLTLLDVGAREARELHADPETQADIYRTLGDIFRTLGDLKRANDLESIGLDRMKAAFGRDSPKLADGLIKMGELRSYQARFNEAEYLIRQGTDLASRRLPANDPVALEGKLALGQVWANKHENAKAIGILTALVQIQPSGEAGPYILQDGLTTLGIAEQSAGNYQKAQEFLRRALVLGRQLYGASHPRLAADVADLGAVEVSLGHYPEAEKLYRESLQISTAWYGDSHPDILATKSILAKILVQQGKLADADSLLRNVLALEEQAFGKQHPYVCFTLDTLGMVAIRRGDLAAAGNYFGSAYAIAKVIYGPTDFSTAVVESNYSDVFMQRGDYVRAESLLQDAARIVSSRSSAGNPNVGVVQVKYGAVLVRVKRYREAEAPLTAGYAILRANPAATTVYAKRIEDARKDLITVYTVLGEAGKAARLRSQAAK